MNWCAPCHEDSYGHPGRERSDFSSPYMINPALLRILESETPGHVVRLFEWFTEQKWQDYFRESKLPMHKSPSFLRMYLAHPMPGTLLLDIRVGRGRSLGAVLLFKSPAPIRMDLVTSASSSPSRDSVEIRRAQTHRI